FRGGLPRLRVFDFRPDVSTTCEAIPRSGTHSRARSPRQARPTPRAALQMPPGILAPRSTWRGLQLEAQHLIGCILNLRGSDPLMNRQFQHMRPEIASVRADRGVVLRIVPELHRADVPCPQGSGRRVFVPDEDGEE